MLNWGAFGGKLASADATLGSNIMNLTSSYLRSLEKQQQLEQRGVDLINAEKSYREMQNNFEKQAGRDQEQGRQQRESIGISGGDAISQVNTSAAGSGIDISSKSVKKIIADIRTQIMNNYSVSAVNEKQRADQSITNAINASNAANSAKIQSIWNDYSQDVERINRKFGVIAGGMATTERLAGDVAGAYAALYGG